VEGGFVLQRQIIVVNSAREGARFGAVGATADDIHLVTLMATSQMFEFTEENAVIAVIHATTNANGDGFEEWTENLYPSHANVPYVKQEMVLDRLRKEGDAANLRLVIVDVSYDHQSLLGLPLVGAFIDKVPIGSWTVMRQTVPKIGRELGCCALPITLPIEDVEGLSIGDELGDIRVGSGPGYFGWLYWNPDNNSNTVNLEANLGNRCNARQKFRDACDGNHKLASGSWVSGFSGEAVADAVRDEVKALVGRYYPVPVWDRFELCNPNVCGCKLGTQVVHIVGFALMEITEVKLTSNPKTISAKFRGWYNGCNDD